MRFGRDSWTVLGILVVITTTYILVVHRSQSASLEDIRVRAAERRRQLEVDAVKASRVPPMIRETEMMRRRYNKEWHRRLPERKELAGFLREISSNLVQERLANQMIAPGNPTRCPLYNVLPITMKFEGNFLALASFLNRVDGMTRLTRIEKLTIVRKNDSDRLAIELGMNIYFTEH